MRWLVLCLVLAACGADGEPERPGGGAGPDPGTIGGL